MKIFSFELQNVKDNSYLRDKNLFKQKMGCFLYFMKLPFQCTRLLASSMLN